MQLTVVGCGDAFGSGGRLQTCFHVKTSHLNFLIDCGATSLIGLERQNINPNDVSVILVSHLHGDHFSGLVWWVLHAMHVSKRTSPLIVVGPEGIEERFYRTADVLFPGALEKGVSFPLEWRTYDTSNALRIGSLSVRVAEMSHPCGAPPYALRIEIDGKALSFSGDTEWVDGLIDIARGADLFICECFSFSTGVRYHMDWKTIESKLPFLEAKRVMLTHMGPEMLSHRAELDNDKILVADDGMSVEL